MSINEKISVGLEPVHKSGTRRTNRALRSQFTFRSVQDIHKEGIFTAPNPDVVHNLRCLPER